MKKNNTIFLVISSVVVVGALGYLLLRQLNQTQKMSSELKETTPDLQPEKLGFGTQFAADMEALRKKQIANRTIKEMRSDFESTFTKKK
jgi:hypothetical protein